MNQLAHSRAYPTAWECVRKIGYDSFSELPGIHLGTSWTVRRAMLMYKEGKEKKLALHDDQQPVRGLIPLFKEIELERSSHTMRDTRTH